MALQQFADVDKVIQAIRLELYRENIGGAMELARASQRANPDPRYAEQIEKISTWLSHLDDRVAYRRAQETQYREQRWRFGIKFLEKQVRTWLGRKTRKMIQRRVTKPEFQLLEREVIGCHAKRVLDGGAGEGSVALALGARHPDLRVDGVEVSATNVRLARQLNRFPNVTFHEGMLEEVHKLFDPESFDLVYSLSVLEHVRDVDATLAAILAVLKPGGRLCIEVPMREYAPNAHLPEFVPTPGFCDHVRIFTEAELRAKFGEYPGFTLTRLVYPPKPGEIPPFLQVLGFGAFFVAFTKPSA